MSRLLPFVILRAARALHPEAPDSGESLLALFLLAFRLSMNITPSTWTQSDPRIATYGCQLLMCATPTARRAAECKAPITTRQRNFGLMSFEATIPSTPP